jgi:branched-chain amino acid aminotransferase
MIIQPIAQSRLGEQDFNQLPFGSLFSDHMLVADYENNAWTTPQIVPFARMEMSPSLSALNYGQAIFEGMKAFVNDKGEGLTFRVRENFERMNRSAVRMCMPEIPEHIFVDGLKALLKLDNKWIPRQEGAALYIRPVLFATDEAVGVKPSDNYRFCIITCPIASYFKEPLKVMIEQHYIRAAQGGVGFAKAAGNYASAMYPTKLAQEKGYHQIIWTDATEHKYLEESGAMNLMLVINNTLITPSLSDSKLAGVTRMSLLHIARTWNMLVEERLVSASELIDAHNNGTLQEVFGCGTAANIAAIKLFHYNGKDYELPAVTADSFQIKGGNYLTQLKQGKTEDVFNWNTVIPA